MKKFILLFVIVIIALSFAGCKRIESPPVVIVVSPTETEQIEFPIICEDGQYTSHFKVWRFNTGWEIQPGCFWRNADGRMFRLGPATIDPFDVYGHPCPSEYIVELDIGNATIQQ